MDSVFAANEPNLGYLHQIRYGLSLALADTSDSNQILFEQIDDISIQSATGIDVYQTKLHIKSVANLSDASPDLWKTLRVWSVNIYDRVLSPEACQFNLITTAKASPDSVPFRLRQGTQGKRDIELIQKDLLKVCKDSTNESNKEAYQAFQRLSSDQQKALIKNICVFDSSIGLDETKEEIKRSLRLSTSQEKVPSLFERLEGWFLGEVILLLQHSRGPISITEIRDKVLDIADSLRLDNLPADFVSSIAGDEAQLSPYRTQMFVRQLEAVDINSQLINHAISDYHRAFSQKSKWLREGLITPADEGRYDDELVEDWSRKFAILSDVEHRDEADKKIAGKAFYETHYVNSYPSIHIKDRFKAQFMITGSCQILSGRKRIGWHPDFIKIL